MFFFNNLVTWSAAGSFPSAPIRVTLQSKLDKFKATFAAPPNLVSSLCGLKTGTGASGETLSTVPDKYLSRMMSQTQEHFLQITFLDSL